MGNKWYDDHNCDWFDEEREHKKILNVGIESACKVAVVASILSILGLIGSAELGEISIAQFMAYGLGAVAVLITSIRVGCRI